MEKASSEIYLIRGITVFALFVSAFILTMINVYQKRQRRHFLEKTQIQLQFKEELFKSQIEIQEQTLKNISQEIHDNIGQTLSLAKLNLNTVNLQKENATDKISRSKDLVSKAIQDLRNLSKSLNTDSILAVGLVKGIETELSIIDHSGKFKTRLQITGIPIQLDAKKELILFRIVQEAINNILKHSEGSTILVWLDYDGGNFKIEVIDDGTGFEPQASSDGIGLRNMKSRAELIGGKFDIQSNSTGTSIIVIFPITAL